MCLFCFCHYYDYCCYFPCHWRCSFLSPRENFLKNKSSKFSKLLRYRGDDGPSPPAVSHTSLQTRVHWSVGGSPAAHTQCMWREFLGLWTAVCLPTCSQVLIFMGSKSSGPRLKKLQPGCKAPPPFHSHQCTPSHHVSWEVLRFSFMGMGWVSLVFPWYLNEHQKVSKVESTLAPSSSQCRPHPVLLFYIWKNWSPGR